MSVCLGENIENSGLMRASSLTEYIFIQQVFMEHPLNVRTVLVVWDAQRTADGHVSSLEASCQSSKGDSWAQILPATHALQHQEPPQAVRFTPHSAWCSLQLPFMETWKWGLKECWQEIVGLRVCRSGMTCPMIVFFCSWACWWCHTMFVIDLLNERLAERKQALVDLCQENERRANYLSVRIGSHTFH